MIAKNSPNRKTLLLATTVAETFTSILVEQPNYLNKYFNVAIVSSNRDSLNGISKQEGVDAHCVPMVRGINLFADLLSIILAIRVLLRVRPDIIHSYTPKAGLVFMLSAWACRVPVRIHTFTGLIFPTQTGLKKTLLIWVDRLICACATQVVPEGNGVKNDLESHRITTKLLNVIGHGNIAGVDTSYFSPDLPEVCAAAAVFHSRLNLKDVEFVFCFVGRINRDKGIKELVQAFLRLPMDTAALLLVGALDHEAPVDNITLELIHNTRNILPVGFMGDIRTALKVSNILILPSYREGFPNVVLQAGAMRLPVIATDISGCNEVIEPAINGWLVPPKNIDELYFAMCAAIAAPKKDLYNMGQNAREIIGQYFERKEHWNRMKVFYRLISK